MKVMGIDIASTSGFSVLEDNTLLGYGKYTVQVKSNKNARFKEFRKFILSIIKKYKPNLIVIEETYVGVNPKTTAYLNMLKGVCIECIPKSIIIKSEAVLAIRRDILGAGKKHPKEEVFQHYVNKFNLDSFEFEKDNDITDAILLADWGSLNIDKD